MLRLAVLLMFLFPAASLAQDSAGPESEQPAEKPGIEMEETPKGFFDVAILQGLNKVTARISQLEAPVGTSVRFGNLEIIVSRCWKSAPNERPENAAMMQIFDRKPDEAPVMVYNGWMFSSSPSLAGLEHPVYDIIVLDCERRKLDGSN